MLDEKRIRVLSKTPVKIVQFSLSGRVDSKLKVVPIVGPETQGGQYPQQHEDRRQEEENTP